MDNADSSAGHMTKKRLLTALIILAVVLVIAAFLVTNRDDPVRESSYSESTTKVTRQDLTDRETVNGALQFSEQQNLIAQSGGTVTDLPNDGSTVRRGKPLWKINQNPTVLMYGSVPAYRTLSVGSGGPDVKQLTRNLKQLGYKGFASDNDYTSDTADAVSAWQSDVGLPDTGTLKLGQVIFTQGAVRIAAIQTQRGAIVQPGTPMMSVSSLVREVAVDLDTADQSLASLQEPVVVTLPDGSEVEGKVTAIGTVASSNTQSGQAGAAAEATIPVTVSLTQPGKASKWDSAPVDVGLRADQAVDVLTVPISALLALAEGGYAVEVVADDSSRQLVAVTTGLFADGRVEISGQGVAEGTTVVIPSR